MKYKFKLSIYLKTKTNKNEQNKINKHKKWTKITKLLKLKSMLKQKATSKKDILY